MSLYRAVCALAVIAAAGACASDGLTAPTAAPAATPEARLAAALRGRVPGVQVPANGPSRIGCRLGGESFAGREPLFVIDGVPMSYAEVEAMELDPAQIVDIQVLKAARATQPYGDRGRYGALLITTRRL